jgi:hypothetical protein
MSEETRAQRLILRGGVSAGFGLVLRLGARLVFVAVAAQLFGAALFGAFSLAVAVVELAVAVGGLGMKRYLFKLLEERGERAEGHVLLDAALLVILASLALAALIAAIALAMPEELLAQQTAFALAWIAPTIAGQALLDVLLAATRWKQRMRYEVVARSLVEPYVGVVAAVLAYLAGFDSAGLLFGYARGRLPQWLIPRSAPGSPSAGSVSHATGRIPSRFSRPCAETALPTATDAVAGSSPVPTVPRRGAARRACGRRLRDGAAAADSDPPDPAGARQPAHPDRGKDPVVRRPESTSTAIASATRMLLAVQLAMVLAGGRGEPVLALFGAEFVPGYVRARAARCGGDDPGGLQHQRPACCYTCARGSR